MMKSTTRIFALILISVGLVGCSQKVVFPEDGMTMSEIYDEHTYDEKVKVHDVQSARAEVSRSVHNEDYDLSGYTRDANNEIAALFPQLPNPTLIMFVYPHLAGEGGNPIPGYSTSFPMYERPHFALPGEVPNISLKSN